MCVQHGVLIHFVRVWQCGMFVAPNFNLLCYLLVAGSSLAFYQNVPCSIISPQFSQRPPHFFAIFKDLFSICGAAQQGIGGWGLP